MRVLLTGSEGLIGSVVREKLLAQGASVFGIDNLSLGQPEPQAFPGSRFLRLDLRDTAAVAAAVAELQPDTIVHLAAIHHIPTCEQRPTEAYEVNILGTQHVLDAARQLPSRPRIVIASSGAVYDWHDGALEPERSPARPRDVYAISKFANEQQLEHAQGLLGGIAVVARIFNTIGPADRNGHLIPNVIEQLRGAGDELEIRLGNTAPKRDYIFVSDTADAITRMALVPLDAGLHRFNIGTGVEHSVTEVIETIARTIGRRVRIVSDPARVRRLDRLSQLADISRTVATLDWHPAVPFAEAIRRTVAT